MHWGDSRPAWLWSADGAALVWRNAAARAFHGRIRKGSVRLAPDIVPLKGQIGRLIRLGSPGRSSLSRVQFLAGGHPVSATCAVTPLQLPDATLGLLVVGVDPIEPELRSEARPGRLTHALLPEGSQYLLIDDGQVVDGSAHAIAAYAPQIESEGLPATQDGLGTLSIGDDMLTLRLFEASPHGAQLLVLTGGDAPRSIDTLRDDDGLGEADMAPAQDAAPELPREPLLPIGLPPDPVAPTPPPGAQTLEEHWVEPFEPKPEIPGLANLFDRLADDEGLYAPLTDSDETYAGPLHENVGYVPPAVPHPVPEPTFELANEAPDAEAVEPSPPTSPDEPPEPVAAPDAAAPDIIAAVIEFADDEEAAPAPPEPAEPTVPAEPVEPEPETASRVWKVTGRSFTPLAAETPLIPPDTEIEAPAGPLNLLPTGAVDVSPPETPQPEAQPLDASEVEQASRYNFDELSRILTDRVGTDLPAAVAESTGPVPRGAAEGSLINLAADTFVLNRLPIGILVFRDQQVLFANRALTDLVGYESIETLRQAGLGAIFPAAEPTTAGPVTMLMRRDRDSVAVRARLQSVPWQGRPALMLSALAGEEPQGHEGTVVSFAALVAQAHEEGYLRADRSGLVSEVSLHARVILGRTEEELLGRPLSSLLAHSHGATLRDFLERPARFAETARPSLVAPTADGTAQLLLFAEGQAGIVRGYFGFLRSLARATPAAVPQTPAPPAALPASAPTPGEDIEPSMLVRLSRGIRRPLNTIVGFADLIRSAAFGGIENARYLDYARDIKTAGNEIATLIDELDDYARLKEGRYATRPAELDLAALLESCILRVRGQAGAARVLVRSAISERLPKIRADRASMGQAVLNLLASAIDQTPAGASVILSAQLEEDGSIAVNVRDSSAGHVDLGERFVVFRDGIGKDGEALAPVRSSVGLALTRSLLAVNTCRLSVDPSGGVGLRFSMLIPSELVESN